MTHLEKLHYNAININFKDASIKCAEITQQIAIEFNCWMKENDTPENAEKYFHFSNEDMFEEFLKTKQ